MVVLAPSVTKEYGFKKAVGLAMSLESFLFF
jgi:hypothetical protein